jgi:hypothetical protein
MIFFEHVLFGIAYPPSVMHNLFFISDLLKSPCDLLFFLGMRIFLPHTFKTEIMLGEQGGHESISCEVLFSTGIQAQK